MDPFAKKMFQSSLAFALVLAVMFSVLTAVYLHVRTRCSDDVVSQASSPGHEWIAEVMERRCGEDAPYVTHVNLRPASAPVEHGFFSGKSSKGEVFEIEQDSRSAKVALTWTAPQRLAIECSGCVPNFLRKRSERWGEVTVSYVFDNL